MICGDLHQYYNIVAREHLSVGIRKDVSLLWGINSFNTAQYQPQHTYYGSVRSITQYLMMISSPILSTIIMKHVFHVVCVCVCACMCVYVCVSVCVCMCGCARTRAFL